MGHLISTELKKQITWWQWYSFFAPILFMIFSAIFIYEGLASFQTMLYAGLIMFAITCLTWWHWCLFTMINMLSIMKDTDEHFETVTGHLDQLKLYLEKNGNQIH
jgi:hypothetical protein